MAILYDKKEMVLNFKEEKPTVYVIKPIKHQQVSFDQLLDEASNSCGVNRAQTKAVVEAVLDRSMLFMDYGMSVKLGDFGTFKPTINVKAQQSADDLSADNVVRKKILFYPGKRFKQMLSGISITRASANVKIFNGNDEDEDDGWQDPNA